MTTPSSKNDSNRNAFLLQLNQAIALDPNNPDIYCLRGNFYKSQGKLDLAQADFLHLIELVPSSAQAYGGLGMVFLKLGDFDSAKSHLLTAQRLFLAQGQTAGVEQIACLLDELP